MRRYNYSTQPYSNNSLPDLSSFNQPTSTGVPLGDIPQSDFAWDQSQVGSYDPSAAATFMSLMNGGNSTASTPVEGPANPLAGASASSDVLGGIMEQKKWGPQGGAPMFSTPNCMSLPKDSDRADGSLVTLVPNC
jgi:hypothetical protein